ncbi:MAG: hypothetical protein Q9217_006136, partial [Psora testacea]
ISVAPEPSTGQLWEKSYGNEMDGEDRLEMRIVASCVERILNVSSIPRKSPSPAASHSRSSYGLQSNSVGEGEQAGTAENSEASAGSPTEDREVMKETSMEIPIYIKVHKKYLDPATLDDFKLPWEWDSVRDNIC